MPGTARGGAPNEAKAAKIVFGAWALTLSFQYRHLALRRVTQGNQVQISGTIPATCCDFKIDRPSFLTVPIKNEIPVRLETTWRPM